MNIHNLIDKSRDFLYKVTEMLGENVSIKPESLSYHAKAKESLRLDLPSIKSLLPYETINEDRIFINRNSIGCAFYLAPSAGADESLMKSLAEVFKNKLPEGFDVTVLLYKHSYVENNLLKSFKPILERGDIYSELAKLSIKYHLKAIKNGYKNARNIPANLSNYCCYLFISTSKKSNIEKLKNVASDFESELKISNFNLKVLDSSDIQVLLRTIVSPKLNETNFPEINANNNLIKEDIPNPTSIYEIADAHIEISTDDEKISVVNCEIAGFPREFFLWQTPDLFANLLTPDQGINCPFLISFTIRGINQEKMKAKAKARAKNLTSNNNAIQNFLNPGLKDEANEWQFVYEQSSKGSLAIFPTFYNLMLFTSKEKERSNVAKAISAYRQLGFNLIQSRSKQWIRFLASLPFMLTEGLFLSSEQLGLIKKLSNFNIANLLPVIADFKGSNEGLLLPTNRNQIFFLNSFDDRTLPITNFNRLTVASPGAGKTLFEQAQILDGLSRGQIIYVIDLGASYKHLCELVGGTYIDATTLSLNPFTLFDFEGTTDIKGEKINDYIQIRDLLAIMASPNEALGEVEKTWLLDATLISWKRYGRKAIIDNVLEALEEIGNKDPRIKDLILLLSKYGKNGIYGDMFNNDAPFLNGSNFVVLEMGGLESNPELLTIVMFVMIVIIQGQFYHSDRRIEKRCIIDEAWRFLASGSNPIAAKFIEQGFRTARKHTAGFAVITQNLLDTSKTIQGRAIASSADTKIIMRQGAFREYLEEHPKSFNPLQVTMINSFGEAKNQGFSNLMIQFGNHFTFHRYFADPFSRVLFSTSGNEFGEIEDLKKGGRSITEAINMVTQKYYGDELCD